LHNFENSLHPIDEWVGVMSRLCYFLTEEWLRLGTGSTWSCTDQCL